MRFLLPAQLLWGLLALVPLLLYLFRRRPRRVPVSSLIFFKALAREHQESAWLRRLKRLLSFLLTLLVLAGVVGSLARLVQAPPAGAEKSVVIVVDRSASMGARDAQGQTRLEAALRAVRTRLAGLPGGVAVLELAFDRQAEVVMPRSYDRRLLGRSLAGLAVRPIEGDPEPALRLAGQLAGLELPAVIWFASDAPAPVAEVEGVRVESLSMPLPAARNVGLTAFEVRRLPLEASRCEAFVQLQATAALEAKVEVRLDGTLTAVRELTLTAGGRECLLLPLEARAGQLLSVRVQAAGDELPEDNEVQARLPEPHTLRVAWVSPAPDPFTQLALSALSREGELAIFRLAPEAWPPKEPVDVVIFQHWLPPAWPAELPAIVIDPPGSLGPVQAVRLAGAGLLVEHVRPMHEHHPLLYGVATARLSVTQTAVLATEGGLEPLWSGPAGPLLAAGEARGHRVVVLGFAPEQSEHLPLSASWPLLLGNALQWAGEPERAAAGPRVQRTGERRAFAGRTLTWLGSAGARPATTPIRHGWAALDRTGLWQTEAGETGSAALLSARETMLPTHATTTERPPGARWLQGDLSTPLLWLVLGVLLAESWLFHRHAVH